MKKLLFSAVFYVCSIIVSGQDYVILKNGDEIKSKVVELGQTEITYKKYDNLDGPSYSIAKSDVFIIKYENGTKDLINTIQSIENKANEEIKKSNSYSSTSMGHFYLSPETSLSFINSWSKNDEYTYKELNLNATAGYFIVDNLLGAITLGYVCSRQFYAKELSEEDIALTFGFQMQYFILGKIFTGAGYSIIKPKQDPPNKYFDFKIGYAGFVSKNISLEPSLTYSLEISEYSKRNILGLNLGLGIYF